MRKYILLLRGINVGGKNTVSMPELKQLFEQNGFNNVMTYINSGNIIFSADDSDEITLKEKCEVLIADKFRLKVPAAVISADDLSAALDHAPSWWDQDKDATHNAIVVIPPVTVDEVFQAVGEIKPEYEKAEYYGNVIFWTAPLKTFSRTRWSKVVGTSVYKSITIRNANTFKKLVQLVYDK
jgi:uncharacterized protein (DUF1697 family)